MSVVQDYIEVKKWESETKDADFSKVSFTRAGCHAYGMDAVT